MFIIIFEQINFYSQVLLLCNEKKVIFYSADILRYLNFKKACKAWSFYITLFLEYLISTH
jgi:hypothetical protein